MEKPKKCTIGGKTMAFLIWIFFQMITSIINGLCFSIFSSLDYIARSIMLYTTQGISYIVFIIFFKKYLSGTNLKKRFTSSWWRPYLLCLLTGIGICMSHKLIFMLIPQIGAGLFNHHEKANFEQTIEHARASFGPKVVQVQYPVNQGNEFNMVPPLQSE